MPKASHTTQYSEYVFTEIKRVGQNHAGTQFNIHQLAECLGLKVTPSLRKRVKEAVKLGMLWDVAPHWKANPRMSEYRFPAPNNGELPF